MALNPIASSGESNVWNYSDPNKPGFSTELVGTVVAIQEVQAHDYNTKAPLFWPEGNPKMNIRMVLCGPNGGIRTWTFQPASKKAKEGKAKSVHLDLFALTSNTDMMNLVGKTIRIATQQPPAGFKYGSGAPRPWTVELVEAGPYQLSQPLDPVYKMEKVLDNNAASGGQVQPQQPMQQAQPMQQMQPVQQMQPMQPQGYAVPEQPRTVISQEEQPPVSVYEDVPF